MAEHLVRCHATSDGEGEEACDQCQRHPVRDRHREEIARGGECHQGREEQEARKVEDHGLRLEAWVCRGNWRRRMLARSVKQTDNGDEGAMSRPPNAPSPEAGNARGKRDRREQQRKADPIGWRAGRRFRLVRRDSGIGSELVQRHWNCLLYTSPSPRD